MCFYNFYMQSHWSRKNHTLQFFWGLGHVPILYRRFGPVLGSVMFHVTFRFRVVTKRSCCASMRADLQWNKDEQRLNSLPSLPGLITYIYIYNIATQKKKITTLKMDLSSNSMGHRSTPFRYAILIGLGTVKGIHRFSRVGGHNATGIWEAPGIWVCHHHVLSFVKRHGYPAIWCHCGWETLHHCTFKWESRKEWWVFHCHKTDCQRVVKHSCPYGTSTEMEFNIKPGGPRCFTVFKRWAEWSSVHVSRRRKEPSPSTNANEETFRGIRVGHI